MMKTKTLLAMLLTSVLLPAAVWADGPLPSDPRVVAGDITISAPSATQVLVQQAGAAGIVDWGSFSIASGYGVQVNNGNGATLNRVTGNDVSSIFGSLSATGSVYLINQNGIVFGKSGVVDTGGSFVASTLDITNRDFLAGGDDVFAGASDAYVINLGRISALGGDVALLGRNVVNEGVITAPDGTVGLVAGREILMRDASVDDGLFSVRIGGSDSSVTESGAIRAAAAELRANGGNVYALAGNTEGTIVATGVAKVKGRVFLTAGNGGKVTVDKAVKATAADGKGGKITVDASTVAMTGLLDVTGSSGGEVRITAAVDTVFTGTVLAFGTAGAGGFVEVSGKHLTFDGTVNTGGGTLLIDPENIEITDGSPLLAGASVMTTTSVFSALSSGNLIIQTTGSATEAGTIAISTALNVSSPFVLTLLAHGDILAAASIQLGDTLAGGLNMVAGWDGSTSITAFDPAVFNGADLATQTIFGNASGTLYIYDGARHFASGSVLVGGGNQLDGVAVGTLSGDTRVFANDLILTGSSHPDNLYGYAQLGYNATGFGVGFAINSNISVRATGDVTLTGGTRGNSAAQIGNIGLDEAEPSVTSITSSTATISIEALGGLSLTGGSNSGAAYAMVGHGSADIFSAFQPRGDREGDITINVGGEVTLAPADSTRSLSWIGHITDAGNVTNANILMTAAAFGIDPTTPVGSGGMGTLDMSMVSANLNGGTVTVQATDSSLTLIGTTSQASCECQFITSPRDLVVQASGDIQLDTDFFFSNTGGGDVALAAGGNFFNNAGTDAFGTMKGRWLVYSTRPDFNSGDIGEMDARFLQYNTVFDAADPFAIAIPGNGLIYAVQPVITVDDASMTYGGALVLPAVQMTVGGVFVDAVEFGLTLDSTFVDPAKVTLSSTGLINAGVYATALDVNTTLAAGLVRVAGVVTDFGQLTVDRAVLTGAIVNNPTKIYNGNAAATLVSNNFQLSGFMTGEDATVTHAAGTYASPNANAFGSITVSATLAAGDFTGLSGTLMSNYVLPTLVTGAGTISQAEITGSFTAPPTKVYDGNDVAILTAGSFQFSGFATGEGATVVAPNGTYATVNASGANLVTALLDVGDYTGTGTTLLANYILPTEVTGNGVIQQRQLTAAFSGTPTKVYDGSASALLTDADFLFGNFATGEGATIGTVTGSYASADASAVNAVTVSLVAGDFAAASGTLLANYVLPTVVTGNGVISRRQLTAAFSGTPTKVYDGNVTALLTDADFLLGNFATGEGATIGTVTGAYADANASGTDLVTVSLAAGDFAADGGTTLANYILPTVVSGNGVIQQRQLTAAFSGTPTKVYDGNASALLTDADFLLGNFATGEGATIGAVTGSYADANASGTNAVTVSLVAGDFAADSGTALGNYVLPTVVTGNGVIQQRQLTAAFSGTPTKVYDGNVTALLTDADFLLGNFVTGQGATIGAVTGAYADANASGVNAVTVSLVAGDFAADSGTTLANYILPTVVTGNGVIQQRQLTAAFSGTPTKVYDGNASALLTDADFLFGNFATGEGATIGAVTGSYAGANASGTNPVTVSLVAGDFAADSGTFLANYVLPTVVTGNGVISQRQLTAAFSGTPTKIYDGNASALLSDPDFLLGNFATGEGATIGAVTGSYASANASGTHLVTVALAVGDFAADGGTLLANYVLPTVVTGNGVISQRVLLGSIIGTPTKVYNGDDLADVTVLLTGFAPTEGATVQPVTGNYASANASGTNLVTAALGAGDFTADSGTLLANYVLPTVVTGNGVISQRVLLGSIIGTPTKVYNGNDQTALTTANFLLTGFAPTEGATVGSVTGTYATANASGNNLVTALLATGDFTADSGTLLANYVLPTTVTGNGVIDQAVLSVSIVGRPTKPYDGTTTATLTAANFLLSGFATGEGATITQTVGSYAKSEVGAGNTVTAELTDSDYAATGTTLLSNYILPDQATGPGLIDNAPASQPQIPETQGLETFDTTPLGEPAGPALGLELISTETTQRIMDEINAGSAFCKALVNQEFVIDCLSDRLQAVADGLSSVGEYSEVRAALEDAADKLHALALANASDVLARTVARANGLRSSRALTAISSAAMGAANAQAAAIIDGARLVLLRSSSGSEQRSVAFSQVAQVVNSTKVLLRSS